MLEVNERLINFKKELEMDGYAVTITELESLPPFFWKYPKARQIFLFELKKHEENKGRNPSMNELLGVLDCLPDFYFRE
jgi:hypothetical protein